MFLDPSCFDLAQVYSGPSRCCLRKKVDVGLCSRVLVVMLTVLKSGSLEFFIMDLHTGLGLDFVAARSPQPQGKTLLITEARS